LAGGAAKGAVAVGTANVAAIVETVSLEDCPFDFKRAEVVSWATDGLETLADFLPTSCLDFFFRLPPVLLGNRSRPEVETCATSIWLISLDDAILASSTDALEESDSFDLCLPAGLNFVSRGVRFRKMYQRLAKTPTDRGINHHIP